MSETSLDAALIRWRNNLIDLTRRNPLLALKPTRSSCLEIAAPGLDAIFEHLVPKNKTFTFWLPPETEEGNEKKTPKQKDHPEPKPTELVATEPDRQRLLQILTNLYRRYQTDYRERGLPVSIVRLFNTVGARQTGRYGMVLPNFVRPEAADTFLNVPLCSL